MALNSLPLASQIISFTQQPIKDNFDGINAGFAVDHVELSALAPFTGANAGKHKKVSFVAATAPSFGTNEFGMYNNSATQTLYIRNEPGTSTIPICGASASNNATNGWSYLPSGIIMQWVTASVSTSSFSPTTVPFPKDFTADATVFSIVGTVKSGNPNLHVGPGVVIQFDTKHQFKAYVDSTAGSTNYDVCFIAIGS